MHLSIDRNDSFTQTHTYTHAWRLIPLAASRHNGSVEHAQAFNTGGLLGSSPISLLSAVRQNNAAHCAVGVQLTHGHGFGRWRSERFPSNKRRFRHKQRCLHLNHDLVLVSRHTAERGTDFDGEAEHEALDEFVCTADKQNKRRSVLVPSRAYGSQHSLQQRCRVFSEALRDCLSQEGASSIGIVGKVELHHAVLLRDLA